MSVDGDDVEAVRVAVGEAVERARRGEGPTLIEALTSRKLGHWAGDKAAYRTEADAVAREDPLERFAARLIERSDATPEELERVRTKAAEEVAEAVERAKGEPDAGPAELGMEEVYA